MDSRFKDYVAFFGGGRKQNSAASTAKLRPSLTVSPNNAAAKYSRDSSRDYVFFSRGITATVPSSDWSCGKYSLKKAIEEHRRQTTRVSENYEDPYTFEKNNLRAANNDTATTVPSDNNTAMEMLERPSATTGIENYDQNRIQTTVFSSNALPERGDSIRSSQSSNCDSSVSRPVLHKTVLSIGGNSEDSISLDSGRETLSAISPATIFKSGRQPSAVDENLQQTRPSSLKILPDVRLTTPVEFRRQPVADISDSANYTPVIDSPEGDSTPAPPPDLIPSSGFRRFHKSTTSINSRSESRCSRLSSRSYSPRQRLRTDSATNSNLSLHERSLAESEAGERWDWEYKSVELTKVEGIGFGIAVSGGKDNPHSADGDTSIIVTDVLESGPAWGILDIDDRLVTANGMSLENSEYNTALEILKDSDQLNLVIKRKMAIPAFEFEQRTLKFTLTKARTKEDFGIVLGCKFYIKDITNPKLAEKEPGLRENDIVLKVNGFSCDDMSFVDAKRLLEKSKEKLSLVVQRDIPRGAGCKWSSQSTLYQQVGTGTPNARSAQPSPVMHSSVRSRCSSEGEPFPPLPGSVGAQRRQRSAGPNAGHVSTGPNPSHVIAGPDYSNFPPSPYRNGLSGSATSVRGGQGATQGRSAQRRAHSKSLISGSGLPNGYNYNNGVPGSAPNSVPHTPKHAREGPIEDPSPSTNSAMTPGSSHAKPPIPLPITVMFRKEGGSVGIRVVGGNEVGIFVSAVQAGSPAAGRGVRAGDKIISANGKDFAGLNREEAVLHLLGIIDQVSLVLQYRRDDFEQIRAQNRGDNFFVRAHFDYDFPELPGEMMFKRGDILQITDTLCGGAVGSWQATKIYSASSQRISTASGVALLSEPSGSELPSLLVKGVIPNAVRAEKLAAAQIQTFAKSMAAEDPDANAVKHSGGLFKRKKPALGSSSISLTPNDQQTRFGSLPRNSGSVTNWDDYVVLSRLSLPKQPAYETVKLRSPGFMRPVVLFGPLADVARERLLREFSLKFAVAQTESSSALSLSKQSMSKSGSGILRLSAIDEVTSSNKHCLLDVTPSSVERLIYAQYCPIVIFMNVDNRSRLRDLRQKHSRAAASKNARKLMELSVKIQKSYSHLFTAMLDATNEDRWFDALVELIGHLQEHKVWMAESRPLETLNDEFLFNAVSRSCCGFNQWDADSDFEDHLQDGGFSASDVHSPRSISADRYNLSHANVKHSETPKNARHDNSSSNDNYVVPQAVPVPYLNDNNAAASNTDASPSLRDRRKLLPLPIHLSNIYGNSLTSGKPPIDFESAQRRQGHYFDDRAGLQESPDRTRHSVGPNHLGPASHSNHRRPTLDTIIPLVSAAPTTKEVREPFNASAYGNLTDSTSDGSLATITPTSARSEDDEFGSVSLPSVGLPGQTANRQPVPPHQTNSYANHSYSSSQPPTQQNAHTRLFSSGIDKIVPPHATFQPIAPVRRRQNSASKTTPPNSDYGNQSANALQNGVYDIRQLLANQCGDDYQNSQSLTPTGDQRDSAFFVSPSLSPVPPRDFENWQYDRIDANGNLIYRRHSGGGGSGLFLPCGKNNQNVNSASKYSAEFDNIDEENVVIVPPPFSRRFPVTPSPAEYSTKPTPSTTAPQPTKLGLQSNAQSTVHSNHQQFSRSSPSRTILPENSRQNWSSSKTAAQPSTADEKPNSRNVSASKTTAEYDLMNKSIYEPASNVHPSPKPVRRISKPRNTSKDRRPEARSSVNVSTSSHTGDSKSYANLSYELPDKRTLADIPSTRQPTNTASSSSYNAMNKHASGTADPLATSKQTTHKPKEISSSSSASSSSPSESSITRAPPKTAQATTKPLGQGQGSSLTKLTATMTLSDENRHSRSHSPAEERSGTPIKVHVFNPSYKDSTPPRSITAVSAPRHTSTSAQIKKGISSEVQGTNPGKFPRDFPNGAVGHHDSTTKSRYENAPLGQSSEKTKSAALAKDQQVIAEVEALIGHEGGILKSPETGVSILVPEGALAPNQEEQIYFKVFDKPSKLAPLPLDTSKGETLLSPVVVCGPQGLKFRKPIELRLPHAPEATSATSDKWSFALKSSSDEGSGSSPNQWKHVPLSEMKKKQNGKVENGILSVFIDHF